MSFHPLWEHCCSLQPVQQCDKWIEAPDPSPPSQSSSGTRTSLAADRPPYCIRSRDMAAFARSYQKFLRVAPQAPALARQMSGGHEGGWKIWKQATLFVALPIIVLGNVNAFVVADPEAHNPPEFVPYDHLRLRTKGFPWGDGNHSLIHNAHTNALPAGFEGQEH